MTAGTHHKVNSISLAIISVLLAIIGFFCIRLIDKVDAMDQKLTNIYINLENLSVRLKECEAKQESTNTSLMRHISMGAYPLK